LTATRGLETDSATMIGFLEKLTWNVRYPWPRAAIEGHVRPLTISRCDLSQVEECVSLYEANIPCGLPPGEAAECRKAMRSDDSLTLAVRAEKRLVGTFGVHFGPIPQIYWLSYLMAAPDQHRRGIGTTMLLAALALLPEAHEDLKFCLSAVPGATKFYNRFGFKVAGKHQHESGQTHYFAVLPVTSAMSSSARRWLRDSGAVLLTENCQIPERMAEDETARATDTSDYVASAAKTILNGAPFAGSLLAEIAGTIIPKQRVDRIAKFAAVLEQTLAELEADFVRTQLRDENFSDFFEDAIRQAARALTDERRAYIATMIGTAIRDQNADFTESKHLLRILGELNDIEVLWLRYHLRLPNGGADPFRAKHASNFEVSSPMGRGSEDARGKDSWKVSYLQHLAQLGLLNPIFRIDSVTNAPVFDEGGAARIDGYRLTRIGEALLRQIGLSLEKPDAELPA
jgi:predicted N-acetyltransferase YhbS